MRVRLVRDDVLSVLREQVPLNLDRYRSGDFAYLELDESQFYQLDAETDDAALISISAPTATTQFEVENCLAVHTYLKSLTPYDARDERLWVYLTHTALLSYSRARWPIPSDDEQAVAHVRTHFFAKGNRQVERDNSGSRLWWMAHLCARVQDVDTKKALTAFLFRSDVRANIIERPTVAQSTGLFSVILKALMSSAEGDQKLFERLTFRRLMVELNSIGGFKLLDVLGEPKLAKILDELVQKASSAYAPAHFARRETRATAST